MSQDGKGPQDAICDFLGAVKGTRASKEAFYNRLDKTGDAELPSVKLPVTVRTFDAGKGPPPLPPFPVLWTVLAEVRTRMTELADVTEAQWTWDAVLVNAGGGGKELGGSISGCFKQSC